jgi:hypothetical protein
VPYNFYISLREWKEILRQNGFTIEKVYGIPFLSASKVLDKITLGFAGAREVAFRGCQFGGPSFRQDFPERDCSSV